MPTAHSETLDLLHAMCAASTQHEAHAIAEAVCRRVHPEEAAQKRRADR